MKTIFLFNFKYLQTYAQQRILIGQTTPTKVEPMRDLSIFPISMRVTGRRIVIVGGGEMAAAKARLITKTQGTLTIVSPQFSDGVRALSDGDKKHAVRLVERPFLPADLDGAVLVFAAATRAVNEAVVEAAHARNIPVNAVDDKDLCDFYTPAIIDRAPLSIAISTEGEAPVLARMIRARLEKLLTPSLGRLAAVAGAMRDQVMARLPEGPLRRRYFEAILTSPAVETALAKSDLAAHGEALKTLDAHARHHNRAAHRAGFVWLIGAGPGAADLLTLRALRAMQEADVLVYDSLVSDAVLDLARRDATRIFVGKRKGAHTRTQDEINAIIRHHANSGHKVARLKGGDPAIFARLGEELHALRDAGIAFEVIPGVTAALAAAAQTATPLTMRHVASSIVFVTAHGADGDNVADWAGLARTGTTLAIYMGRSVAAGIAAELMRHGLSANTPAGIVENATLADEAVHYGTLGALKTLAARCKSDAPALILIGDTIALGEWQRPSVASDKVIQAA